MIECKVEENEIVIRMPVNLLSHWLEMADFNCADNCADDGESSISIVTDPVKFAEEIVNELTKEEEDGTTPVHLMIDKAMEDAIENGCEGVSE